MPTYHQVPDYLSRSLQADTELGKQKAADDLKVYANRRLASRLYR